MDDDQIQVQTAELDHVTALRDSIADLFAVSDTTLDYPEEHFIRFRGRFLKDPADFFGELRLRFEVLNHTPVVHEHDGNQVSLVAIPHVYDAPDSRWTINLVLFIATVLSTLFAGAAYSAESMDQVWQIWRGWPFSLSVMTILGAHELGHYFAGRYHRVPVTLPYFIPMPLSAFGTFGAFIRLQGPINNRRALFDVGAAGPLAGLVFALPILFIGLTTSDLGPITPGGTLEGNSVLYLLSKLAVFGQVLPGNGVDVYLNQVAWAGWVGLFVTGLNLIPVGQLDGGHIAYALLGERAKLLFWPVIAGMGLIVLYSFLQGEPSLTWLIWIGLLMLLGRTHARPLEDISPLDTRRQLLAITTLALFVLLFVPFPLTTTAG